MIKSFMRPTIFRLLSEPATALFELGTSYPYKKIVKKNNLNNGDGHPVMLFPGFLSTEKSIKPLKKHIEDSGYEVYDWGLGRNMGKLQYMDLLLEALDEIYIKTGKQVSLVGWSLGGIYARQLAKERPQQVRQVITLASPFAGLDEPNNIAWIYSLLNYGKSVKEVNQTLLENLPLPAPVPTTAIYSKLDGIVPWRFCMEKVEDKIHQNIEVRSSHLGMGVNFSVLNIIIDRLSITKENWSKFEPKGLFNNRILFPSI